MKSSGEHRRGRSMGSAPPAVMRSGEKDEDLALFHEMKRREKHNFLHPSPDDLDATLSSKFGGMGAPSKKPGTDLLTSESDKNDYDWLLTPPGTPLFPSLDQEAAALAVLSPALSNGSYSSASSATKSLKSSTYSPAESVKGSRGNLSPRRQTSTGASTPNGISRSRSSPSTAPILTRPSTPTSTGGTRPSTPTSKAPTTSVRSSTPTLKLTISHSSKSYSNATTPTGTRPSTPTARPSTPGGRSSTPTSKPSTPTMRRSLSGGRTGIASPSPTTTRGGPSPKRSTSASRGNSPSAKRITSVITSIAGMSSEAPPNLRTTMPERSTSNGSNYNNVEDSAQSRRRPRSPSVARSVSSSSSQEQRTSSQTSRGSVVSSYDDGIEVNRPSSYGSGRSPSAGKWHANAHEELLSRKASAHGKRLSKSYSSRETSEHGVGPSKKSSDLVKRPMDAYQNSPASAYRNLHSSSPVSPFYSTRTNSLLLRAGVAMNSSMTASSNASSEHGTIVAADTEGSERDEDDLLSWDSYGRRTSMSPRLQQADILVLDKDEEKTVPWQDALFERANSHGPSSCHSQGSQSTLDTEVTGFYETDGIASLEMLEQLGLMGENYQKSSSPKMRSSEKRASSTEDTKITNLNDYGLSKISPSKIYQEDQGSPAQHSVQHLVGNQEIPERPRSSRDFDAKIPSHLVFHENFGSPVRHLANLEKQQELPERPSKSRDFESSTSPHRRLSPEDQGSPSRRLPQLEKQDSLERPRRSRDSETKTSPHRRFSLESQGSPYRRLAPLEKQDRSEPLRSSREFETELMRRSWEKSLGVGEPQVPSSEIRAACLFVRDFKVGLSPPHNQDFPGQVQEYSPGVKRLGINDMDNSPGVEQRQGIEEMDASVVEMPGIEEVEMKVRNELSYERDNSVETEELPTRDPNGDTERRLSHSPVLASRAKKNVGGPKSSARLSLEFPFTPVGTGYQMKINDSVATPEMSTHVGATKPDLTLLQVVEVDHPIAMNGRPTSAEIDDASLHDGAMDESETESTPPKDVDMDSPIPQGRCLPNATEYSKLDLQRAAIRDTLQFTSHLLGIQSDLSDDEVKAMDDDVTEMHSTEDGTTASVSEDELAVLEESMEGKNVHTMEKQRISPMDVHEGSIAMPENHEGVKMGGNHDNCLQFGTEQEAAIDEVDVLQCSDEDTASEEIIKVRYSGTDNEQVVVEEEEGMWYSEVDNQQDVVENFLQAVPFSLETNCTEVVEEEFCYGEDGRDTIAVESDPVYVSDRQVTQECVHSNGNHLLPSSKYVSIPEKESISHDDMESVLTIVADNHGPQKLPGRSDKLAVVDVMEISPSPLQPCSAKVDDNQESAVDESYITIVDQGQKDLPCVAMLDGTQDPIVELVNSEESQDIVNGVFDLSDGQWHEESQSLEYVKGDFVAPEDDTGDEAAGYNVSNHLLQEELQSPKYSNSESPKQLHHLSAAKDEVDFLRKDIPLVKLSSDEAYEEEIDMLDEFDTQCVENKQLPYAIADADNCQLKSIDLDEKHHPEVLDLSPGSDDVCEVPPPNSEIRSASTLCAALEDQIAGLVQIDSAIEESSKPFSASPQESLLLKDKRSILETHQDKCAESMRSSQEEDLIDMLWADGERSSSEESRDQDFLNSKDCSSQMEMNGVVSSCRLSDRVLPISILSQSNDGYDAVVRASRSDLGVEKPMLEGTKGSTVLPVEQLDAVVAHMHSREPMKSPYKIPLKSPIQSPLKSPVKSPFLCSTQVNACDPLPEAHFHSDAESKTDNSIGEGGQANLDDELRIVPSGLEHGCDVLKETSSSHDVEEKKTSSSHDVEESKTDAELLSLCKSTEWSGDDSDILNDMLKNSVLVSPKVEAGPVETEVAVPEKTLDADSTRSEGSTGEAGESLQATERAFPSEDMALENASREVDMSNIILSSGNTLTVEARDQAIQEQAHSRDRDESPVLLTLARSELTSQVVNEAPNEEWLQRKSMLPKEISSRAVPPMGHMAVEPAVELHESQSFKEREVEMTEGNPSYTRASELVHPKLGKEETKADIDIHLLSNVDIGCVQMAEIDVHPLRLSSQNDVSSVHNSSLGAGAVEDQKSSSRGEIKEGRKEMRDTHVVSDGIVVSNQSPKKNSATNGVQHLETTADSEVNGADSFTGQDWQEIGPQENSISPKKSQISPSGDGAGKFNRYDEFLSDGTSPSSKSQISPLGGPVSRRDDNIPSEAAVLVQEIWMSQGRPDSPPPRPLSNGSGEDAQIPKVTSDHETHNDSSEGQHVPIIHGKATIDGAERESFRVEENDSGAELGGQESTLPTGMADMMITGRGNGSDVMKVQESPTHFKEDEYAENHPEIPRLGVIKSGRDLPALNLTSPSLPTASSDEIKAHHEEDLGVAANGDADLGTREDEDAREGNQLVKRTPISKANSVRTVSLSPKSRTRSASEEPSSPEGEVGTPQKCDAGANISVISPEGLQWDHSSPVKTPTKARSSPASLSRNMTLAEATDTILYCSSLMHTIVCKAAAYAIEKEELAALASTPISSGDVPHFPGLSAVVDRQENDSQVGETGSCKLQGVNNGPPSVRRALSYTGHHTVPLTPADTSLQIPVDQAIERVNSPVAAGQTASPVKKNDEVIIPVKVSKAKCGCTIM